MARRTKTKTTRNYDECHNTVSIAGYVTRIIADTDKVIKFGIDVGSKTEKGNTAHAYLTVVSFDYDGELAEDELVAVEGKITTRTYDGKYYTEIVADNIIK